MDLTTYFNIHYYYDKDMQLMDKKTKTRIQCEMNVWIYFYTKNGGIIVMPRKIVRRYYETPRPYIFGIRKVTINEYDNARYALTEAKNVLYMKKHTNLHSYQIISLCKKYDVFTKPISLQLLIAIKMLECINKHKMLKIDHSLPEHLLTRFLPNVMYGFCIIKPLTHEPRVEYASINKTIKVHTVVQECDKEKYMNNPILTYSGVCLQFISSEHTY